MLINKKKIKIKKRKRTRRDERRKWKTNENYGDEEEEEELQKEEGEKRGGNYRGVRTWAQTKRSVELFCSTFECIKLYCVPASIVPDVAMSGAARVNEPFPGPLAAEYYIDNRNCLPSVAARVPKTFSSEETTQPAIFWNDRSRTDGVKRPDLSPLKGIFCLFLFLGIQSIVLSETMKTLHVICWSCNITSKFEEFDTLKICV